MTRAVGVAERVKVKVASVNEVVAVAVSMDVTVVVGDVETHAARSRTMWISPTHTETSLLADEWERLGTMRSYVLQ